MHETVCSLMPKTVSNLMHETLCACVRACVRACVCVCVCNLMPEIVCNSMLENTVSNGCPCPKKQTKTNKQTVKQNEKAGKNYKRGKKEDTHTHPTHKKPS